MAGDPLEEADVGTGFRIEIAAAELDGLAAGVERDADRRIEFSLVERLVTNASTPPDLRASIDLAKK